jgi:hypothetical protein
MEKRVRPTVSAALGSERSVRLLWRWRSSADTVAAALKSRCEEREVNLRIC